MNRHVRFGLATAATLAAVLIGAEVGRRILDGYRLTASTLVSNPASLDLAWSDGRSTEALLRSIPLDLEADASWFFSRPQPLQGERVEWADIRRSSTEAAANYVWNSARLSDGALQALVEKYRDKIGHIFTFPAPDGHPYPFYRLYPGIETGFGFTNRFGWRSREIAEQKPPRTIRIAMLGDSTTGVYPRLVEHWLNLWAVDRRMNVTFEIINAARPATGALDAAAIAEFELDRVDPDFIVLYGFGNGIYLADGLVKLPDGVVKGRPGKAIHGDAAGVVESATRRLIDWLEPMTHRSAAVRFVSARLAGRRGGRLEPEPPKPKSEIVFPPGINEHDPDPQAVAAITTDDVMGLNTYLRALDAIDVVAKQRNIEVFVSTFRVMAFDGMLLAKGDPNNGGLIYSAINEQYWWPYGYAQIRRLLEFYNRTLRAWVDAHDQNILPIDEQMPWRPELYGDGLHELPAGEAMHAWVVMQNLMPAIRERLARGLPAPRSIQQEPPGYWRIDTLPLHDFRRAAAAPPPDLGEELPGAYPLSNLSLAYEKASITAGKTPLIVTGTAAASYAAGVAPDAAVVSTIDGRGYVTVRVRVLAGGASIGVLSKDASRFLATALVPASPDVQQVGLAIPSLRDLGTVMLSNAHPQGAVASQLELHGITLSRRR